LTGQASDEGAASSVVVAAAAAARQTRVRAPKLVAVAHDTATEPGSTGAPAELALEPDDSGWIAPARRSVLDRLILPVAIGVAAVAHGALLIWLLQTGPDKRVGLGGLGETIAIEMIAASDLKRPSPTRSPPGDSETDTRDQTERKQATTEPARAPNAVRAAPQNARPIDPARPSLPTTRIVTAPPAGIVISSGTQAPLAATDPAMPQSPAAEGERTEAPSDGSEASAAQSAGQSQPPAADARPAGGRRARGFDATIVSALPALQSHLMQTTDAGPSGLKGALEIQLTIGSNGAPENVVIVRSSGTPELDRVALRDVRSFRFPAPPRSLSATRRTYRLPLRYQ